MTFYGEMLNTCLFKFMVTQHTENPDCGGQLEIGQDGYLLTRSFILTSVLCNL